MAPLALAPAASSSALDLTGTNLALVVTVAVIAIVALVMGFVFRRQVLAADPGTDKMQEIGAAVEEGAQAYLARQFKTLAVFVVLVFGAPAPAARPTPPAVRWGRSGFFVVGARLLRARSATWACAWPPRPTSGSPRPPVARTAATPA